MPKYHGLRVDFHVFTSRLGADVFGHPKAEHNNKKTTKLQESHWCASIFHTKHLDTFTTRRHTRTKPEGIGVSAAIRDRIYKRNFFPDREERIRYSFYRSRLPIMTNEVHWMKTLDDRPSKKRYVDNEEATKQCEVSDCSKCSHQKCHRLERNTPHQSVCV